MKEVLDVLSGLQIMALREASLVPSYVGKTQLVLTNEIVTELFNLSTQLQFCLNLNRCAIHTLWNNGDLIKQTHRECRLRVLPIFSGQPAICLIRRAWHMQLRPMDQSSYVDLARQCCLVAHPWAAASLHTILVIFTAAGLTKFFPGV